MLRIEQLNKSFARQQVLRDINLSIGAGEFLVLVGPSGCGKSTLLNIIAGLEQPTSGQVLIEDKVVNDLAPAARDIAMVFQSYALYPTMNVAQNIAFGLEMRKVPKQEREQAVQEVAKSLHIEHLLKRKPGQLSGGQRQRVAMGRALVRKPRIFLFDEPLSNLDAKLRVQMRSEIKRMHQSTGTTIVYVTHDQIEAMTLASTIVVLEGGDIQQIGAPDSIYRDPANAFVASFMGSPPMNMIPVRLHSTPASGAWVALCPDAAGVEVSIKLPWRLDAQLDGSMVTLGLRSEDIGAEASAASQALELQVELTEPTGADTFAVFQLGGAEVNSRLPPEVKIQPGARFNFHFDLGNACLFQQSSGERIRPHSA